MIESVLLSATGVSVASAVTTVLRRRGLDVLRSFDFRLAPESHPGCTCPYHGTPQCECGFIVLLIYGGAVEPAVLTLHGRDNQTQARIVRDANTSTDPRLAQEVLAALVEVAGKYAPAAGIAVVTPAAA